MDSYLSYLWFGDTDTSELSYKNETAIPNSLPPILHQASRPASPLLHPDDVLEDLLSTTEAQHIEEVPVKNVQLKTCEICGKNFEKVMQYYGHLRVHSKDNVWCCAKCPGLKFSTKQQLMKHDLEHNPVLKKVSCSFCQKEFNGRYRLQQHVRNKHINYRTHQCDHCSKAFLKASDLQKHKDTCNDIKKQSCPECGVKFRDKSNCKRDTLTHEVLKPFSCSKCGFRYNQSENLKRHSPNFTKKQIIPTQTEVPQAEVTALNNDCDASDTTSNNVPLEQEFRHINLNEYEDKFIQPHTDIGQSVDALVDDILSVEDDYSIINTTPSLDNNSVAVFEQGGLNEQETTSIPDNVLHIEFLKEMNQLHSLDDELFYNDIDFDSLQPSQVFDLNGNDYDYGTGDNNTEIFFDFATDDKNICQDVLSALQNVRTEHLPDELLDIPEFMVSEEKRTECQQRQNLDQVQPAVSVNECATIFESDVDLEESSNLAANLNQLIGENNVQYISTEDDDTFIISLNSGIDAAQLTDMLNIDIQVVNDNANTDTQKAGLNVEEKEPRPKSPNKKNVKKPVVFVCNTCKKTFKKKSNFRSHLAVHNPARRRNVCEVCGERFSYKSTLNKHMKALHIPRVVTLHSCQICGVQYKEAWLLKEHKERDHYGIKRYMCTIKGCNKKFYKEFDNCIHHRYHNRERTYTCEVCDQQFLHASHLQRHVRYADCTKYSKKNLIIIKKNTVKGLRRTVVELGVQKEKPLDNSDVMLRSNKVYNIMCK